MPPKPTFTEPQIRILREATRKIQKRFRTQEELALALGITQPSLSALLRGKWKPGLTTARAIAHLESTTLEELIGPYAGIQGESVSSTAPTQPYPNLEACLRFYSGTKAWAPWTVAAARAGICGETDLPPPSWPERLDMIEKALERIRK